MKPKEPQEKCDNLACTRLIAEEIGRAIAKHIWRPVWIFLFAFSLVTVVRALTDWGKDATDSEDGRSGMKLHIDAETGVEYLSVPSGGIIVRQKK